MTLQELAKLISSAVEIAGSFSALVIAIAGPIIAYKTTGKIDLEKTMHAADDAKKIIEHMIVSGQLADIESALRHGVELVEGIRGKKISEKMKRKVRARVEAHIARFTEPADAKD